MQTYAEELDVIQDMIVEREVIAGNGTSAGVFLDLPVRSTKSLSGLFEVLGLELTGPVCLSSFLELTVGWRNRQKGSIDRIGDENIPPMRGNPRTELFNAIHRQPRRNSFNQ